MSSIYKERNWKDEPTTEEEIKYQFICAASLLGIMDRCYFCKDLRDAMRKLEEKEVQKNENQMD